MADENQWTIRTGGALSAHFFQPDGSSRPGTDWIVEVERGEHHFKVLVRAYLSEDMTRRARADEEYQRRAVLGYVSELLGRGWTPEQEGDLEIVIQNPPGEKEEEKSWWRFW
jgi:hypothetical protein